MKYIKKKNKRIIGAVIGIIGLMLILIYIPPWIWLVMIGAALAYAGVKLFFK